MTSSRLDSKKVPIGAVVLGRKGRLRESSPFLSEELWLSSAIESVLEFVTGQLSLDESHHMTRLHCKMRDILYIIFCLSYVFSFLDVDSYWELWANVNWLLLRRLSDGTSAEFLKVQCWVFGRLRETVFESLLLHFHSWPFSLSCKKRGAEKLRHSLGSSCQANGDLGEEMGTSFLARLSNQPGKWTLTQKLNIKRFSDLYQCDSTVSWDQSGFGPQFQ